MPAAALPASRTEIPAWRTALEEQARTLGFASIGVAAVPDSGIGARRLREWLTDGAHGGMEWMASRADERGDMRVLWPAARSLIVLGLSYAPAADPLALAEAGSHGRISVYAQGADYHDVAKRALKALARWLVDAAPALGLTTTDAPAPGVKVFVDTAPVMEKPLGQLAGLGWQGKHTNLVSRREGSWLFLGVIATTLALAPDAPHADRCGSCDACQRACPTDAFPAPYRLDARRCISYLTIEHKGPVPAELRKAIGNRVYGCDDCLAVCPWNRFAKAASGHHAFLPRAELAAPDLASLLDLDDAAFRRVFAGSPIKRIGRERMVRNAAIAAGNSGDRRLAERLAGLVADPSPLVRGAAIWALAMLDPPRALAIAERHAAAEDDDDVRAEWEAIRSPRAS